MADFYKKKPFGPYTSFVYLLLVIAALEFIGLAGVLASDSQAREPARTEPVQEPLASSEEAMPEWLEPAEKAAEEKQKPEGELTGPEILAREQVITHGLGAVGQRTVLNCLEGFQAMYEQGVRVFEADLRLPATSRWCCATTGGRAGSGASGRPASPRWRNSYRRPSWANIPPSPSKTCCC